MRTFSLKAASNILSLPFDCALSRELKEGLDISASIKEIDRALLHMASGEKSLSHNMFATSITDAKLAYTSPQPLEYSLGAKYPMKCRF